MNKFGLTNVYDFLHLYAMDGRVWIPREEVIKYIVDTNPNTTTTNPQSQLRMYERFKKKLQSLDIEFKNGEYEGRACLKISNVWKHKSKLEEMLDTTEQ